MANDVSRRSVLMAGVPGAALAFQPPSQVQEVTVAGASPAKPEHSIQFAVIGMGPETEDAQLAVVGWQRC